MNDKDRQMALLLQKQFDMEINIENPTNNLVYYDKRRSKNGNNDSTKSLTDPSWELVDPTPNIHILFVHFNERFFWNKLLAVTVSWSKRMTTCAGICSYQGRGGLCKVTLSEPLLKLRPRKDLVETLLHEMIHALLFVTSNNRDRDGHGPEFHKHMHRINNDAGTKISVYHDFHDEVRLYQQHWWRCDGPCQHRKPFFGVVRRAMNRAPGPNDRWWAEHQHYCGGRFTKVREPEKNTKGAKSKELKKVDNANDLRKYIPVLNTTKNENNIKTLDSINSVGTFGAKNKNGTIILNAKTTDTENNNKENIPMKLINNIVTFKDLSKIETKKGNEKNGEIVLKSNDNDDKNIDYSTVRNHWLNKFADNKSDDKLKRKSSHIHLDVNKKIRMEIDAITENISPVKVTGVVSCPVCNKSISEAGLNAHLDKCLQDDNNLRSELKNTISMKTKNNLDKISCPVCNNFLEENELNDHLDVCLEKTNDVTAKPMLKYNGKNDNAASKDDKTLVHCEICDNFVSSEIFTPHVAECLNKCYDEIEKKYNLKTQPEDAVACLVCNQNILKTNLETHLDECMGTVFDDKMIDEEKDIEDIKKYNCPFCLISIPEVGMTEHIDECLINNIDVNHFD